MIMALSTLTACGSNDEENHGEEMTKLVLGTSADYAPFEFMYPDENGDMQYGGIDIYVSQYIADYMGLELQVENMSFNNLLTSLGKGQFDMVLADIEATDERKEATDFSDPYLTELAPQFLVKAENADQFKSYSDFEGKTIGAQTATTKYNIISEIPDVSFVDMSSTNFFNFSFLPKYGYAVIQGVEYTLILSVISVLMAVLPALLLATMRLSKNRAVRCISGAYIAAFRSTPILVQLMII